MIATQNCDVRDASNGDTSNAKTRVGCSCGVDGGAQLGGDHVVTNAADVVGAMHPVGRGKLSSVVSVPYPGKDQPLWQPISNRVSRGRARAKLQA